MIAFAQKIVNSSKKLSPYYKVISFYDCHNPFNLPETESKAE